MVSKKQFSALLATVMILSVLGMSTVAVAQPIVSTKMAASTRAAAPLNNTIYQVADRNASLTTLVRLLEKANLTDTLNGPGNFTVFAPTNQAFAALNNTTLAALNKNTTELKTVLLYHVVPKKLFANNFTGNGTITTINGLSLPYSVNGTTVTVGDAKVTKANINASNGVIHLVSKPLLPPPGAVASAVVSAKASPGFLGMPGFEAVYAVAGLLAVAYLVIRRRK
jgi:PGF-CTERM protein